MSVRVLMADSDEYLLPRIAATIWRQHGFEVFTATTGLECVEKLRDEYTRTCWFLSRRTFGLGRRGSRHDA